MLVWHLGEAYFTPPENKPDLWVVLNVVIGAVGFGICYLWTTWQLILRTDVLNEWFGFRADQALKPAGERAKALPLSHYFGEGWFGGRVGNKNNGEDAKNKRKADGARKQLGDGEVNKSSNRETRQSTKSLSPTPEPNGGTRRSPRKKRT